MFSKRTGVLFKAFSEPSWKFLGLWCPLGLGGILWVWVSSDIAWECVGKHVFSLNHARIRGILLVWVSLDIAWECFGRQVF